MTFEHYEVVVAGGSVAGLLVARELAANGITVVVLEEDHEIGTPEHCSGVLSVKGLCNLGIVPDSNVIQNFITKGHVSCLSSTVTFNAENKNVAIINRRLFDKQIASQAQKLGAIIKTRTSFRSIIKENSNECIIRTSDDQIRCHYLVDARGIGALAGENPSNVLPSAQFEIYADWISGEDLEIRFDADLYPGFFAWLIPIEQGKAKVGVAGRGISVSDALKNFINSRGGKHATIRKIFAPIWVGGPIDSFYNENIIKVGDSAGQTKPSTAGGIYSCGMAGILAGRAISEAVKRNESSVLKSYDQTWRKIFQNEFNKLLIARKLMERLDNKAFVNILNSISDQKLSQIVMLTDFDFHSSALSLVFGTGVAIGLTKGIFGNEYRKIIRRVKAKPRTSFESVN